MIGFNIDFTSRGMAATKKSFFNQPAVERLMDRTTHDALGRFGAFVMTTAKHSIRHRKRPSQPGEPPTNQTGTLKRFIYFVVEAARRSVIIGPAKLNMLSVNSAGRFVKGTIPEVLEKGGQSGTLEVHIQLKNGRQYWRRADLRSRRRNAGLETRVRRVTIAARPYMGPAYRKEITKLPAIWQWAAQRNAARAA